MSRDCAMCGQRVFWKSSGLEIRARAWWMGGYYLLLCGFGCETRWRRSRPAAERKAEHDVQGWDGESWIRLA